MIYTVRGIQVMLDSDLAALFEVETKVFNQAVKRNQNRFPSYFRFQLTKDEYNNLRSQFVTLKKELDYINNTEDIRTQNVTIEDKRGKHKKYLPYVFTEHGVAMLPGILRSDIAVEISIKIINAFVEMRKYILSNALLLNRIDNIELRQLIHKNENDAKFEKLFKALDDKLENPKENIFFNGQIYDAYKFIIQLIEKANDSILLIDNYVDISVLNMLTNKKKNVKVTIITHPKTKLLELDVHKFNQQYPTLILQHSDKMHDRFLLIDNTELYHIGASLKDLGNKCFAFSLMENKELITHLLQNI